MALAIRELPAAERPRERLRTHGAQALSSSELLAILLGSGSEGRSASGIGQEIPRQQRLILRLAGDDEVAVVRDHGGGERRGHVPRVTEVHDLLAADAANGEDSSSTTR